MSRNQTVTFLKQRFAEAGIQIQKQHGQNFLIDLNLQRLIVEAAALTSTDVVLEVGTGTGALTALMAEQVAAIVTVEIDPAMYQVANEELIDYDNVTMLQQDALRNKNKFHPVVLDTIRDRLAEDPNRRFKLVANLPYNVATPVLSNLLSTDVKPVTMTATIQKELADRIAAVPGTKDYSALSIWIQCQCHVEILRVMPPEVFWPRPKVNSAIIQLTYDPAMRADIPDPQFFHEFVRSMFLHRRKFLRGVVVAAFKGRLDKPQVDEVLAEQDLGPTCRAEELDIPRMIALSEALRQKLADVSSTAQAD